jgi:phosphohistidine swiveling domain-containing protein
MRICVELTGDREGSGPIAVPAEAGAAVPAVGGKARSLQRLADAGLRVPAAFAVTDALFRRLRATGPALPTALRGVADLNALDRVRAALLATPWPPGFGAELGRHLDRLAPGDAGARFSVRSSFLREDRAQATGAGAGVYESIIGVARGDVPSAIGRVLASALSAGAVAYARARGENPEEQATAVLIHRTIDGDAWGSGAFDPASGEPPVIEVSAAPGAATPTLDPGGRERIAHALQALAARHGAVEVEWVSTAGEPTFLQLRPYAAPPTAPTWAPGVALGQGDWRWDVAHNPLPLSPAQAGLVAIVDEGCRIGIRQRVAGGYLFFAKDGPPPWETIEPVALADAFAALSETAQDGLDALGEQPALEEALALFVRVYDRLFGAIQPALRRAARELEDFLRANAPDEVARIPRLLAGVTSLAGERRRRAQQLAQARSPKAHVAALSAYLSRFGDEAPIWDVAVPTYREDPQRLPALSQTRPGGERDGGHPDADDLDHAARGADSAHRGEDDDDLEDRDARDARRDREEPPSALAGHEAAQEIAARLPATVAAAFAPLVDRARLATSIGEDDDALYARVQAAVRAALRGEGAWLAQTGALADPNDVFWLPLNLVRRLSLGEGPPDRASLARLVVDAREAHERALQNPPPGGTPTRAIGHAQDPGPGTGAGAVVIQGRRASAGRIIGRAFLHRPTHGSRPLGPGAAPTRASIVVAATLLPTELPLLQAAGLVVESGGVLGHVAAQARERGIPALVEAHGATTSIADGDLLLLDADAGQVIRLG